MLEVLNEKNFYSIEVPSDWPKGKDFILKIPSKNGFAFYKKNAEIFEILKIEMNKNNFQTFQNSLQPYILSDSLVHYLKRRGIVITTNQPLAFSSPNDYWDYEKMKATRSKVWDANELKEFFKEKNVSFSAICVTEAKMDYLRSVYSLAGDVLSFWDQLEIVDLLECHREPFFFLKLRQCS